MKKIVTKLSFLILVGPVGLLLVAAMGVPTFAQQSIGTILGVVKDTSGGTVPQAKVTVTNMETNETRTDDTGSDGAYRFPALKPGPYVVKIEKEGFKTQTQTGLILNVAQELVVSPTMEVGSAAQDVTVTGEAPLVNTTTSGLGSLVNEERMAELPLNGRNYVDLTLIQPGVNQNPINTAGGGGISGTWFSANGAPARSNNFSLDGAPIVNAYGASSGSENGTTLGVDGIREYKIVTSAYSAEYGMTMGAQMVIVSKGGSNQFHGDVFEYIRNDLLDARNFFDTPQSAGTTLDGAQRRLPLFQRNNFGGSVGGPIKKDRTFFYGVYEGLRLNQGLTVVDTVIPAICKTALVRNGAIYNFDNNTDAAACASGLTAATVIPANMVPFINLYPNPTNTQATNNYSTPASSQQGENYGQMRVDQTISTSDSFFGRYTIDKGFINNASTAGAVPPSGTVTDFPQYFRILGDSLNQFISLGETHIVTPQLLNTARISFDRTNFADYNLYSAAFTALNIPSFVAAGLPMGLIGAGSPYTGLGGNGGYPTVHVQNIYTASDDVFYTRGRHALKFGVLFNRYNSATDHSLHLQGSVTFTNLANFMQGIYNTYSSLANYTNPALPPELPRDWIYNTYGFYAQDDLRATSRLTLNLGLRYDFQTVPNDQAGTQSRFVNFTDLSQPPTTNEYSLGPPMQNPGLKNFSPRIGFAWDVFGNGKTSVRSGSGIYYDIGNIGGALQQQDLGMPPYSVVEQVNSNPNNAKISFPLCYTAACTSQATVGGLQTIDYNAKTPYSYQYNFTVEQQLPMGMGLAVSYVGFQGHNLWATREDNPYQYTSLVNGVYTWDPITCNGVLSAFTSCPSGQTQATNPTYQRLNPSWSSTVMTGTTSRSWYNSLQVVVNKRLSHGLQFQGAYTYSKSIDTTEGQQNTADCGSSGADIALNPFNPAYDRGPSCFDATHNMHLNLLYHFSDIKSDNTFIKNAVNGWWVGNIVNVQTGFPFTPLLSVNRSNSGVFGSSPDRPDVVTTTTQAQFSCTGTGQAFITAPACGSQGTAGKVTYTFVPFNPSTVNVGSPNEWFNPLMFQLGPPGQLGDVSHDLLRGPGLGTWNFSINKDTKLGFLGEDGSLQFRAEIFNILNRANFAMPSGTVFTGTYTASKPDGAGPTEAPISGVGQISSTQTSSRQIQLALKIIF